MDGQVRYEIVWALQAEGRRRAAEKRRAGATGTGPPRPSPIRSLARLAFRFLPA
jgi:hypothetical protein